MNTLIAYASKHGTTEMCASNLSRKLKGNVELHNLKNGSIDLAKYDKVIIGGSIYGGRIQKDVSSFCAQNLEQLKNKDLGLFICCMFPDNAEAQLNTAFPEELVKKAVVKENFGGEMRFSDMSFAEKALTKMVSKIVAKKNPDQPPMDMKRDVSQLIERNIDRFSTIMNSL